jgi:hypothetical protein
MKTSPMTLAFLLVFQFLISVFGQASIPNVSTNGSMVLPPNMRWGTLILTPEIVRPDSVRVFGPDKGANLSFAFVNKTQEEIAKIMRENLGKKIPIQDADKVLAVGGAGGGLVDGANTIGLVLIFESKAAAKIAARVLRGQKDQ